jgi:hypothetical protein
VVTPDARRIPSARFATRWPSIVVVEALTMAKRAVPVEFRVYSDTVEIWEGGRRHAIVNRPTLARWLADPRGPLTTGGGVVHLDPRTTPDDGRAAVTLPGISGWVLSPAEQANLKREVA